MRLHQIIRLLAKEYGASPRREHRDPLSELIYTVLSQNTSDVNSKRAFANLKATFGTWEEVAKAKIESIAGAIRHGGLANVKAPRIKQILQQILAERGNLDLSFLSEMEVQEVKAWLMDLPGVGPKTASCVLLFSLGKPAMPVDTHVYRVTKRLGLIDPKMNPEKAHEWLQTIVLPEKIYTFHLNLVEHGRKTCQARLPLCHRCVVEHLCPYSLVAKARGEERVFPPIIDDN